MDKQPKKQNNKAGRLLLMAVLAVIVIYAGARFTQSPQQPAAIAPAESAQPISGGLTLLTEPPAESAQPEAGAQPEAPVQQDAPEAPAETPPAESGSYTEVEDVAYYLHTYGHLPDNYLTKSEAEEAGWVSYKGNLWDVAYGTSIGGDRYGNYDGQLPKGERYYEADVNYDGGYRGEERIVYTEDGDIWYTSDHYESFERLY